MRRAALLLVVASSVASAEGPLSEAARQAWLLAYSRGGDVTWARERIKEIAIPGTERRLAADLYSDLGRDRDATVLWRSLIHEQPRDVHAALYQARIVEAALRIGSRARTSAEVTELVRTFSRVERPRLSPDEREVIATARELAERELSALAVAWHREKPDVEVDDANRATDLMYEAYLTLFPTGEKAYALRYYWAEFLYDQLNAYERAAEQYTQVLLADVAAPTPGKFMEKAAFNAVLAREQVVRQFEQRR